MFFILTGSWTRLYTVIFCLLLFLQRGWYASENEYYLLIFTLTVRCLYYTSFSLEYCWAKENMHHSFLWMLSYVFYYPVLHNGPIITFDDFHKQVTTLPKYCLDLMWDFHSTLNAPPDKIWPVCVLLSSAWLLLYQRGKTVGCMVALMACLA